MHPAHDIELATRLQHMNTQMLAPLARYGHVALLLAASGMSALIAALLATESALPLRTQMSLGALLAVGLAWVGYATWVLRQRRPLFARHRVVAGRMAVGFSTAFFVVATTAFAMSGAPLARNAALAGLVMLVLATVALLQANIVAARLVAMRLRLEQATGAAQG